MSHHDTNRAAIERRKVRIMRAADTNAIARYNLGGVEKTHRQKPKPVTLPSAETVKRILGDDQ
jgi:hypothetical protein